MLFVHIPKTGGTSVEGAFVAGGWTQHLYTDTSVSEVEVLHRAMRSSQQHFHGEVLQSVLNLDAVDLSFSVVRHPVARFRSEYSYRNAHKLRCGLAPDPWDWAQNAFAEYARNPYHLDNHLRPQVDFLVPGLELFRFEDGIDNILAELNDLYDLGIPPASNVPGWARYALDSERESGVRSSQIEISPVLKEHLDAFYQADFEVFGYAAHAPGEPPRVGLPATVEPAVGPAPAAIDPSRIIVSTVFESRPPYLDEPFLLFSTLIANGGALAGARKIALSVGEPDEEAVARLHGLGVEVRVVEPFDARCPHANKLAMLELATECDVVLALDTDIAVAGDASPWLGADIMRAKPVDHDSFGLEAWRALFALRGLALPRSRHLTHVAAVETIPYFNSGVIAVPAEVAGDLHRCWSEQIHWLLDHAEQLPQVFRDQAFYTDQVALALALAYLELPVEALPLEMNFPTHVRVDATFMPDLIAPVLLHHHHRVTASGFLLPSEHDGPNSTIDFVNLVLAAIQEGLTSPPAEPNDVAAPAWAGQATFDNEAFWNDRYSTDIELGSGVGSRGEIAERKRDLIQQLVDAGAPGSILDVGCGDIAIMRQVRFEGDYTGIDIADRVLDRNRALMPGATFLHGDFPTLAAEHDLSADMVVCLDVLIHQHDAAHYAWFVEALVAATRGFGVIAAYEENPAAEFFGEITAYHGPITEQLARVGVTDMKIIDEYRGVAVVLFGAPNFVESAAPNDIDAETLARWSSLTMYPHTLRELVARSRQDFGWYTRHALRCVEYPWIIERSRALGRRMLDIGAGIAPVVPYLTDELGKLVTTVDLHRRKVTLEEVREANEWGFFDYADLTPNARSFNVDVARFETDERFDVIYSISVIEHMPADIRRAMVKKFAELGAAQCDVLLTVDLYGQSMDLWNRNEGVVVEPRGQVHGTLHDLIAELEHEGFVVTYLEVMRRAEADSVGDLAMIHATRT